MAQLEFEQRWRKRFEKFAQGQTEAAIAGWSESGLKARIYFFKSNFTTLAGKQWLDIGCGAGTYCRLLDEMGVKVIGLDYSWPSLVKAQQRLPSLTWLSADAYHLPFKQAKLDGVLCFGVLQTLQDESRLINEMASLIKSDGEVWLDGLNQFCIWHVLVRLKHLAFNKPIHLHTSSPWRLKKRLTQQGFLHVKIYWAPILPQSFSRLQRLMLKPRMQKFFQLFPWFIMFGSHAFYLHAYDFNLSTCHDKEIQQ